jgi:hypothetical protein
MLRNVAIHGMVKVLFNSLKVGAAPLVVISSQFTQKLSYTLADHAWFHGEKKTEQNLT